MKLKDIKIPKNADINELDKYADPDMDVCKFVSEYGTIGSSLVFAKPLETADMSSDHKDVTLGMIANMQKAFKVLREKGSCNCSFTK